MDRERERKRERESEREKERVRERKREKYDLVFRESISKPLTVPFFSHKGLHPQCIF